MISIYPNFDEEFPSIPDVVARPELAAELPVGTILTAGTLTAIKKARQYSGGRAGWWVRGFTAPEPETNSYPVVETTLFRYATIWTVKHV